MSLSVEQILLDAKKLASKLKEHDTTAESLITQTQSVHKQIDAMKQYADEIAELNETARQRPHSVLVAGIQQESRNLRELQQENRELRSALVEHQHALELIMSKYRLQITHLIDSSKVDQPKLDNQHYTEVIHNQAMKIKEMAAVMSAAAKADEEHIFSNEESLYRLNTENQGLRELLDISTKYGTNPGKSEALSNP